MVVEYSQRGGAFEASKPRVWAEARLVDFGKIRNFDVHPDGKRIVVVAAPEPQTATGNKPVLYFNFFDEIRRVAK